MQEISNFSDWSNYFFWLADFFWQLVIIYLEVILTLKIDTAEAAVAMTILEARIFRIFQIGQKKSFICQLFLKIVWIVSRRNFTFKEKRYEMATKLKFFQIGQIFLFSYFLNFLFYCKLLIVFLSSKKLRLRR